MYGVYIHNITYMYTVYIYTVIYVQLCECIIYYIPTGYTLGHRCVVDVTSRYIIQMLNNISVNISTFFNLLFKIKIRVTFLWFYFCFRKS